MPDIARRFSDPRPIILDGATSTELQRLGVPMSGDTWSGLATITHPDILRDPHVQYLKAGAEVIAANTCATAPQRVAATEFGDRAREINMRSAESAGAAASDRNTSGRCPSVCEPDPPLPDGMAADQAATCISNTRMASEAA